MSDDEADPNVVVRLLQAVTPNVVRRSFALKFGLVLAIMAVSIGAIGFVATDRISAETSQNVQDEYTSVAQQEADIIEEWVETNRLSAQFVSSSRTWDGTDPTAVARRLNTANTQLDRDVFELHVLEFPQSGGAEFVASTSNGVDPGPVPESGSRSWVRENLLALSDLGTNDVFVKETYSVGGQRVFGFVSPVPADRRYLLIEVEIFQIISALQGEERAEGGFTQVVDTDADNQVIIAENIENVGAGYADSAGAREPLEAADRIRGTDTAAGVVPKIEANSVIGEVYTVGYSPVDVADANWTVLTHAPRSSVFGFVQTVSNFGLVATAGAVLLIAITGSVLGYSTSSAIDRLTAKTETMREGDLDVSFATSRVDNIGRLYDGFAEMRDALREQIDEAERARKEAEVSRAEAVEMSNYLEEKAQEYSRIMQQCAAGDLTRRMEQDGENESMDVIAAEFNGMIAELEKTTGQLKSYVDEVEAAGSEVEGSASTVREASEQVADSIQKISDDAYDQKERLQSISETMDDVAASLESLSDGSEIEEPLARIQEIAGELNEIADLSEETMAESENVAGAAEEQAAELNEVSERANDLQRYAQPLRDILGRFETEAEHEFVFSVGPTGPAGDEDDD